jgi:hypothetical protein
MAAFASIGTFPAPRGHAAVRVGDANRQTDGYGSRTAGVFVPAAKATPPLAL